MKDKGFVFCTGFPLGGKHYIVSTKQPFVSVLYWFSQYLMNPYKHRTVILTRRINTSKICLSVSGLVSTNINLLIIATA